MTELPIILDDFVEKEQQNQIQDAMFDCSWQFKMDNTYNYDASLMGIKYRKFLNPFEYDISPSIITNLQTNQNIFKLFNPIIEKTCNHIDFNLEKMGRCIAGIQGVQVIRKQNKVCNIHVNQKTPHLVLLYYVNDADGETILYDKTIDDIKAECDKNKQHFHIIPQDFDDIYNSQFESWTDDYNTVCDNLNIIKRMVKRKMFVNVQDRLCGSNRAKFINKFKLDKPEIELCDIINFINNELKPTRPKYSNAVIAPVVELTAVTVIVMSLVVLAPPRFVPAIVTVFNLV